ncbi:hypothetical protein FKW77_007145 [Venturia effusa]|uniref:Uncharacterized protein n=1 Tax=Venturia effusa TaxID=50376 RepID=A0A517L3R4_9PEZI|nr:hypothetical protein FKW77_007145 [Venturia effusa]
MAIDWKSPETTDRLLTCIYAWLSETNTTINHQRIAELFGNNATYNAVQGNFRKFKQGIEDVKAAAPLPVAAASKSRVKKMRSSETTATAAAAGVLGGRIAKSTPKKSRAGKNKFETGGKDGV